MAPIDLSSDWRRSGEVQRLDSLPEFRRRFLPSGIEDPLVERADYLERFRAGRPASLRGRTEKR